MLNHRLNGFQIFIVIWLGQFVSLLGTAMTRFALLIWAYQQTGQATTLALLGFFSFVPYILASPFAGVVVDRFSRRWVMLCADLGAGLMTLALLLLYATGHLQIWHLYLAQALSGAFEAFQLPAYSAATTMLVPKEHYGRAAGLRSLAGSASELLAPFAAGGLLLLIGMDGIMLIDVGSFLLATIALLLVRIPPPPAPAAGSGRSEGSIWGEMSFGFHYILGRPGLFGLLLIYVGMNLFATLTYFSILPAMVLVRAENGELALAAVQSALGLGGVAGGFIASVWGGPKQRIHGILSGAALSFLLGDLLFALGRSAPAWSAAAFLAAFFIPFISSAHVAIWQAKVAPHVQGRVFSVKGVFQQSSMPLGYLLAGPLADRFFEPAMAHGGSLAGLFGSLVGTGPGAGMALMFLCTGLLGTCMGLSGYLFRPVREVEADLPDHELAGGGQRIEVISGWAADGGS
jgi:MFS family permease